MKEIEAKQFYIHKSYANVYYYIYIALEKWIAKNIFRNDLTRVFLASNDFAFRRRFELTDASMEFEDLKASDLQFPFANYWPQNIGWSADQRIAGVTAKMAYLGIYEGNTKLKAIPSILSIPVTFYFDREDDARLAYDILYFQSFNEHYYYQDMPYGSNTLRLPINIAIKDLTFNPSYKETDWLKDNRLYIVTADIDVRSFAIQPPLQPDYNSHINETSDDYNDGIANYYLTEKVILNPLEDPSIAAILFPEKNLIEKRNEDGTLVKDKYDYLILEEIDETVEEYENRKQKYLEDFELQQEYMKKINKDYMDLATTIVDNSGQAFQSDIIASLDFDTISSNSLKIDWVVSLNKNNDDKSNLQKEDFLNKIVVEVPSKKIIEELDPSKNSYILNNLIEDSQYLIYVTFYGKKGNPKKLGIIAKTAPSTKPKEEPENSLVGLSW